MVYKIYFERLRRAEFISASESRIKLGMTRMVYRTASFKPLPALNLGTFMAGIWILAPVFGLTPFLAALLFTWKAPKPVKTTLSPFCMALVIVSITDSKQSPAAFFEQAHFEATASISSSLVIFFDINYVINGLDLFKNRCHTDYLQMGTDYTGGLVFAVLAASMVSRHWLLDLNPNTTDH